MSAFHSSAYRRPIAVLSFHAQRQFTVRSCDLRLWSRTELQAEVPVSVRVMWDGIQHWVVAKDVCALIGKRVGSVGRAIYAFNRREKARMIVEQGQQLQHELAQTADGAEVASKSASVGRPLVQVMSVLSERGVRRLLVRTRSERAQEVQQFIDRALLGLSEQQQALLRHNASDTEAASTAADTARQFSRRTRHKRKNEAGDEQQSTQPMHNRSHRRSDDDTLQHTMKEVAESGYSVNNSAGSLSSSTEGSIGLSVREANKSHRLSRSTADVSLPGHSAAASAFSRTTVGCSLQQQQRQYERGANSSGSGSSSSTPLPLARAATPSSPGRYAGTFRPIVLLHTSARTSLQNATDA